MTLSKASDVIKNAQSFLLSCHVHPDGDALGSTVAMAHALQSQGKKVTATFSDPFIIPEALRFCLPQVDEIVKPISEVNGKFDVIMTFDCGSKSRLGDVVNYFDAVEQVINVDHHISNEGFGTINIIDPEAASSGSVVLDLLDELNIDLTKEIAQCLYVALLTDTGRFQFSSTTADVFDQARRYAEFDLPIAQMSRVLTEEDPYSLLKLAGEVLTTMQFDPELKLVSAFVSLDMRDANGVAYEELENVIEFVRRTKEADVAFALKEFQAGDYRGSLRSLGEIDVCKVAEAFEGGGHKFAAGFSSTDNPENILIKVKDQIELQRG